jgi:hypothetical protein
MRRPISPEGSPTRRKRSWKANERRSLGELDEPPWARWSVSRAAGAPLTPKQAQMSSAARSLFALLQALRCRWSAAEGFQALA